MSAQTVEQFDFDFLPHLPVIVQPHQGQLSSDAGLLPLRQFDQHWDYTRRLAQCLIDPKPRREDEASRRRHSLLEMTRQRLFGIVAGYPLCRSRCQVDFAKTWR